MVPAFNCTELSTPMEIAEALEASGPVPASLVQEQCANRRVRKSIIVTHWLYYAWWYSWLYYAWWYSSTRTSLVTLIDLRAHGIGRGKREAAVATVASAAETVSVTGAAPRASTDVGHEAPEDLVVVSGGHIRKTVCGRGGSLDDAP